MRVSHLGENFVEPLKRPVKVNLDPARCGCHVLSVIFSSPTFDEAHSDGAHFGQLKHGLEAVVDGLRQ